LLERIGAGGRAAFHAGAAAHDISAAVQALGGVLSSADLAAHATVVAEPLSAQWGDWRIMVQPPMSQGVLLAMAVQAWSQQGDVYTALRDHVGIEVTQAAFAHRDEVARGQQLLEQPLTVDLRRASHRGGPRAYLHTAGVAVADSDGMIVSSLVSVFDDFGSAVYVPGLGITLNNRAGGFTQGANAAAPGKRPVHTLATALLQSPQGILALATPGADGQVQTLLQLLVAMRLDGNNVAEAIARPRWRSENGQLLIERNHAGQAQLASLGHRVVTVDDGDVRFGAVVCAGLADGGPMAAADWRRETAAGAAS
jgi:gamma-glutamyltranspeptidase/glutathione hydrolase